MKYHYRIVSSFDVTDIPVDSKTMHKRTSDSEDYEGFTTEMDAEIAGEEMFRLKKYNEHQYYVKTYPVPENVEDQINIEMS